MPDEPVVDAHLGAVVDEMITAIQETKQAVWSATDADRRRQLEEVRSFLAAHVASVAEAEDRIGGRAPTIVSPTGHRQRNLRAEAGNDGAVLLRVLCDELDALAADVRRRSEEIGGTDEAALLATVADGVDQRVAALRSAP